MDNEFLYIPRIAKLIEKIPFTEKETFFRLTFPDGKELGHQPGQFVQVSVLGVGEAPISVSSSPTQKNGFELCVRASGSVTNALSKLSLGDKVGIRGPYGQGFKLEELNGKDLILIGGGIGLVPLRSLINYALDCRKDFGKLTILYGCRLPSEILYRQEISKWEEREDVEFRLTVDAAEEGWSGHVGLITTLIPPLELDRSTAYAVIVGPPVMYQFVLKELKKKDVPDEHILVSLERMMQCGVGKCGHCTIGEKYCCIDGPVFKYSEIRDIKGAI
jgi:sulfhydrogenase subunit gamma (sulfur reductase)